MKRAFLFPNLSKVTTTYELLRRRLLQILLNKKTQTYIIQKIYNIKQGTVLILGAYSFHSMIGAMLLQPVKWHMKNKPILLETAIENSKISTDINDKQGIC